MIKAGSGRLRLCIWPFVVWALAAVAEEGPRNEEAGIRRERLAGVGPAKKGVVGTVKAQLEPGDEATLFLLPDRFHISLVASEPTLINPVCMTLDEEGRLYVSESHTYRFPADTPIHPPTNPIIRLDPRPTGGGYRRVLVAEGFDDPVMGMAIRDGKLWCTSNNFLYQFELSATGQASQRKTLLFDRNKARNPHGNFRLDWGPDGLLYMSVGDHPIDIVGPTNGISGRGPSGIVLRMRPDGSDMQRLVHGLRTPFPFEFDPFGQLWLLSNGQGNPNRFVRVIEGVDYHCFSRDVDYEWLAGANPLAPPCFELARGAWAGLVRYYGSQFPESYQGSLFLCNWGAHGFPSPNHTIFRYVPDEYGNIVKKETWLSSKDPHFRPTQVLVAPDGGFLIADWYARDDESDLTGRIWKVTYSGDDKPEVTHRLESAAWKEDSYTIEALGSADHRVRKKATEELLRRPDTIVRPLAAFAARSPNSLGAAGALWVLLRRQSAESLAALARGTQSPDWRIRRLAMNLLRRSEHPDAANVATTLRNDESFRVQTEAALALREPGELREALWRALKQGAASDPHTRYEAAWHLAKHAETSTWSKLLAVSQDDLRTAVWIALDIAVHESFPSRSAALNTLAGAIQSPSSRDIDLVLDLAKVTPEELLVPSLLDLVARHDMPASTIGKAILVLRLISGAAAASVSSEATEGFLEAVRRGELKLRTATDVITLFEILESQEPTPFAVDEIAKQLFVDDPRVRFPAHRLARKFGPAASALTDSLWSNVLAPHVKRDAGRSIELVATLLEVESEPDVPKWVSLLTESDLLVTTEVVRSWRDFVDHPEMVEVLVRAADSLIQKHPKLRGDLARVLRDLEVGGRVISDLQLAPLVTDKGVLFEQALTLTVSRERAILGRRVFERGGCVTCHADVSKNTDLAPSLKGIGKDQSLDYLIESILEPSKVIKMGYLSELVVVTDGRILTGVVREEEAHLRIVTADSETRIAKADVQQRVTQSTSLMPTGLEKQMSRQELHDLLSYMSSLE